MGDLIIGPKELVAIRTMLYWAAKPEHVWDPPPGRKGPLERHQLVLGSYRTIYRVTRLEGEERLFRYLSIHSYPRTEDGCFPGPAPVIAACRAFGFLGPVESWRFGTCNCGCLTVNVQQPWAAPLMN